VLVAYTSYIFVKIILNREKTFIVRNLSLKIAYLRYQLTNSFFSFKNKIHTDFFTVFVN